LIWIGRNLTVERKYFLDNTAVKTIDAALGTSAEGRLEPAVLQSNRGIAFEGTKIAGAGFILAATEAHEILARGRRYHKVISHFLGGEDVNNHPAHEAARFIINFRDMPLESTCESEGASSFPAALEIVSARVRPKRLQLKSGLHPVWMTSA
jgi:hypothetical protein